MDECNKWIERPTKKFKSLLVSGEGGKDDVGSSGGVGK